MGSSFIPLQQAYDVDLVKEPFEYYPFIVRLIYGTLCLISSSISTVVNFTFNLFCSCVFKSLAFVDCTFQMLDALLEFSKTLLQFNYILVSRGLTVFGQFVSKSSVLLKLSFASLYKFLICSYEQLVNVPLLCFQTAVYLLAVSQEFLLTLPERMIESCNAVYIFTCSWLRTTISNAIQHCLTVVTAFWHNFAHLTAYVASEFVDILDVLHKQASSFAQESIYAAIDPIIQKTHFVFANMLVFLHEVGQYFILSVQKFFALLLESTRQINIIFEQLGEWISMPFTFTNLNVIFGSVILIIENIINIFILAITLVFQLVKSCLAMTIELIIIGAHLLVDFKTKFSKVSLWIVVVTIVCFAILFLSRNTLVLHKVMILWESIYQSLPPLWHRNVVFPAEERLIEEVEMPREEVEVRHDQHGYLAGNDERPLILKPEGKAMPPIDESFREDNELTICIVCQDEQRSTVLLPCRHLCLCKCCAESLHSNIDRRKRVCPLCRENINDIMDVYI